MLSSIIGCGLVLGLAARSVAAEGPTTGSKLGNSNLPNFELQGLFPQVPRLVNSTHSNITTRNSPKDSWGGHPVKKNYLNPFDAWQEEKAIEPLVFWSKDVFTAREAQAADFTNAFISEYQKGVNSPLIAECVHQRKDPMSCMVYVYSGDPNFGCGINNLYKCAIPKPQVIMDHVERRFTTLITEQKVHLARTVYFSLQNFEVAQANLQRQWDLLHVTTNTFTTLAEPLIKEFTLRQDKASIARCKLVTYLLELARNYTVVFTKQRWYGKYNDFPDVNSHEKRAGSLGAGWEHFKDMLIEFAKVELEREANSTNTPEFYWPSYKPRYNIQGIKDLLAQIKAEKAVTTAQWKTEIQEIIKNYQLETEAAANGLKSMWASALEKARIDAWEVAINGLSLSEDYVDPKKIALDYSLWLQNSLMSELSEPSDSLEMVSHLPLTTRTAKGFCGNVLGLPQNDDDIRGTQLKDYIRKKLASAYDAVEETFDRLQRFEDEGDYSTLRAFLAADSWVQSKDIEGISYKEEREAMEGAVAKHFISELWTGGRCFVEVNKRDDAQELCAGTKAKRNKDVNATAIHRYCPDNNTVLQASCLTKKKIMNHKQFLYGHEHVEKYNFTVPEMIKSSWELYKTHGKDSFASEALINKGSFKPSNVLRIPVCNTFQDTIVAGDSYMPFGCGNYKSNETHAFLSSINVDPLKEKNLGRVMLAKDLRSTIKSPLNHFLLLCELNVRWPCAYTDKAMSLKLDQKYRYCDDVRREIAGMAEFEANRHFCQRSQLVKKLIFPSQSHHVIEAGVVPNPKSANVLCKQWVKDNWAKDVDRHQGGGN